MRFGFWNVQDWGWSDAAGEGKRRELGFRVAREQIRADVLGIAELRPRTADPRAAEILLREFAEAVGMECEYAPGKAAAALGDHGFGVGLCWRPGIAPVPDTWAATGADVWHRAARLHLDIGGVVVQHAVYHAPPFGRHRRSDEAERIVAFMARPNTRPAGLIGGDWNAPAGDVIQHEGYIESGWTGDPERVAASWEYYDPDGLAARAWHPDFVHQCTWDRDHAGNRTRWRVDRAPGEILVEGGLTDAAASLGAPWQQTTGHRGADEGDPFGPRRIDAIKATPDAVGWLRDYEVITGPEAETVSDHLPIAVTYQPPTSR